MIFGKTTTQKEQAEQARLKALYEHRQKEFALWPVKLQDGRIAWLRWVYVEYPVVHCKDGEYYEKWWKDKRYYTNNGKPSKPTDRHFLGV